VIAAKDESQAPAAAGGLALISQRIAIRATNAGMPSANQRLNQAWNHAGGASVEADRRDSRFNRAWT
jgi:hypothetical protein